MKLSFMDSQTMIQLASPGPLAQAWAYRALAGGRSVFGRADGRISQAYHHHTLILTLSGEGVIELGRAYHAARPGSLAWLDTSRPYAHGATGEMPWVYLWVGIQGAGLDLLHKALGFAEQPVVHPGEGGPQMFGQLEEILAGLGQGGDAGDGRVNQAIAGLARALAALRGASPDTAAEGPVGRLCRRLRQDPGQDWTAARMAAEAGLSPAQMFRRFRQETGTTPRAWLRRERVELAGHLLAATSDKISTIAQRCGYGDPFHFSRDFNRISGQSPRAYRLGRRRPGSVAD